MNRAPDSAGPRIVPFLCKWGGGFVFSFVFIWVVAFFFTDMPFGMSWDQGAKKYTAKAGDVARWRSEGWGTTTAGPCGVKGRSTLPPQAAEKIAIWGDSHVEALQVNDRDTMGNVLTGLFQAGSMDVYGLNIGDSGLSAADYYYNLAEFERCVPNVRLHVILVCDMGDVSPGEQKAVHAQFLSEPEPHLSPPSYKPSQYQHLTEMSRKTGLFFLLRLVYEAVNQPLAFFPGTAAVPSGETDNRGGKAGKDTKKETVPEDGGEELRRALAFLLRQLDSQADAPLAVVYCPHIPYLWEGAMVLEEAKAAQIAVLEQECRAAGIDFLDLRPVFVREYQENGVLPRGFPNSFPGRGHLNKAGHGLVARAIFDHLMESGHVFRQH